MNRIFEVTRIRWFSFPFLFGIALSLSACGGDDDSSAGGGAPSSTAPTISGSPPTSTLHGREYSFRPTAQDPNGDPLTFSISGAPSWATFDRNTGALRGTPSQSDVGTSSTVVISVSDGTSTASLPSFNLQVVATASGSATLTWMPPTHNADGTPLTNLASYRVYFGMSSSHYPNSYTVSNPGVASFVVEQLTPATWYFVVTAVSANGSESIFSNAVSKTVR